MPSLLRAGATHALWRRQATGDLKMTMTKVRSFPRWAMAGCSLAVGSVLAITSAMPSAIAADLGDDAYLADEQPHYERKSRGSGHTFDVPPEHRHPRSVAPHPNRSKNLDRYAYRERADRESYDDAYNDVPRHGSLKDDIAPPDADAPRWGHEERWQERDYADRPAHRSFDRWSDRRSDRWTGAQHCIPKRRLRRQLRRAGWRGFRRGRVRGNIGYMVARQRGTGEIYELAVDRCTGEVISASCVGNARRDWDRKRFRNRDYREDVVIRW